MPDDSDMPGILFENLIRVFLAVITAGNVFSF
jgi:hypothetical protein